MDWITILIIAGAIGASIIAYWVTVGTGSDPVRWCIVRDESPFGLEILYIARTQKACSKWRTRRRVDSGLPMFLMSLEEVNRENAKTMRTVVFWAALNDLRLRGRMLAPPSVHTDETVALPLTRAGRHGIA